MAGRHAERDARPDACAAIKAPASRGRQPPTSGALRTYASLVVKPASGQVTQRVGLSEPAADALQQLSPSSQVVLLRRVYTGDSRDTLLSRGVLQLKPGRGVPDWPLQQYADGAARDEVSLDGMPNWQMRPRCGVDILGRPERLCGGERVGGKDTLLAHAAVAVLRVAIALCPVAPTRTGTRFKGPRAAPAMVGGDGRRCYCTTRFQTLLGSREPGGTMVWPVHSNGMFPRMA